MHSAQAQEGGRAGEGEDARDDAPRGAFMRAAGYMNSRGCAGSFADGVASALLPTERAYLKPLRGSSQYADTDAGAAKFAGLRNPPTLGENEALAYGSERAALGADGRRAHFEGDDAGEAPAVAERTLAPPDFVSEIVVGA